MNYKFTDSAKLALEIANDLAIELKHNYVGTEHLLYGIIKEGNDVASKILQKNGLTSKMMLEKIEEIIGIGTGKISSTVGLTPRTKRVIENAFKESKNLKADYITPEHLLIGIIKEGDSIAIRIMLDLKIDFQKVYNEVYNVLNKSGNDITGNEDKIQRKEQGSNSALNQYGTDLTKLAKEGKIDPVIGRKQEIDRITQILSRRIKNNPCLIGEPGVGKTAIIEGLATKIVQEDVPDLLINKRIITLDIPGMVAGAKYRGDFEDRIKKCLNEVKKSTDIILFIDEIHTIVGAGAAEGAIDAANILKPLLARGEIQLIGATTINEYRKYIEKDTALERRLQTVIIDEPKEDDAIEILKGLRDKYEAHHNVKITDESIISAVKLSKRYISDRYLPDKAVDLIDEAASKIKLELYTRPSILKKQEEEIEKIQIEKEKEISMQNFEKAAKLRDEERELRRSLEEENKKWENDNNKCIRVMAKEDIASVISNWTGIPANKINQTENQKLMNLNKELSKRVIGQENAIEVVAKAIKRARVGLKDPKRPIGSFMFLGPTGVGKTELSKALAESLFGDENSITRIDMSEYMESYSTSKIIGSPPGYVGYDDAGGLTEKIRRKPYSVILFDEIEKAHPDVLNLLLQILEDGRLTDSHGKVVDFKNTVIIMTSNIGARLITDKKTIGFKNELEDNNSRYEELKKEVMQELKKSFRPEFINRIDDIIVFSKLTKKEMTKIADLMIDEVKKRLEEQKIELEVTEAVKEKIIENGIDENYGARPLRRAIKDILEDKLAEAILKEAIKQKDMAKIYLDKEGNIKIKAI